MRTPDQFLEIAILDFSIHFVNIEVYYIFSRT